MEGFFYVKHVSEVQNVQTQNGDVIQKVNVVLSSKECRVGEGGVYAAEVDYAADMLGERCRAFAEQVKRGEWITATLLFMVHEYNGAYRQDVRLGRWAK